MGAILVLLALTVLGVIIGCAYGGRALIRLSMREPEQSAQPPAAWIASSPQAVHAPRDRTFAWRLFTFLAGVGVIAAPFIALCAVFVYLRHYLGGGGHWPPG